MLPDEPELDPEDEPELEPDPLPRPGGQTEAVRHSYPAPSPPWALLVWQMVYFSEIPWLCSLACPASIFLRVSRTEMDPWITKVLFLASLAYEACCSSSHEQQLDWHT